jgi:hypothetical protein
MVCSAMCSQEHFYAQLRTAKLVYVFNPECSVRCLGQHLHNTLGL